MLTESSSMDAGNARDGALRRRVAEVRRVGGFVGSVSEFVTERAGLPR